MTKKVFVSGCYDLLHSGHVEFFQQASRYGDLYVGIGSDATYLEYKHRKPMFPQEERLFMVKNIKAVKLPKMDPEMLARLVFCFENNPERHDGIISGAQDSIGICVPGLVRHYYDNNFWPEKIESTLDEMTLRFLEDHLVMIPMEPRRPGCRVVEGKDITPEKVKALADAADVCWKAILAHDLDAFAAAYRASFEAQIAMFPGMVNPSINGVIEPEASVQPMIDRYSRMEEVLAWKMPGAGGGGYLALVVKDSLKFAENHDEAIHLQIRRA